MNSLVAGGGWLVVGGRRVEIIQPTTNHQPPTTVLEIQLQSELHLARVIGLARDASESRLLNVGDGRAERHAVEHVEQLPAEVHVEAFRKVEALLQGDVLVKVRRQPRVTVVARR